MIPGVSRSGATIIGALSLGVERRTAAEFSFFLAIPTMLGATTLELVKNRHDLGASVVRPPCSGAGSSRSRPRLRRLVRRRVQERLLRHPLVHRHRHPSCRGFGLAASPGTGSPPSAGRRASTSGCRAGRGERMASG
jgi:hypothetical protein